MNIKIEKVTVQAKKPRIDYKYTFEEATEVESFIDPAAERELGRALKRELLKRKKGQSK